MSVKTDLQKEQDVPMFEYNSAVKELVQISKDNKERIDHEVVIAKSNLSQLRQEHIRLQGEFNQWKMGEEQKFKNELSKRHNQLIDQENKMNILHRDLIQRDMDFKVKEERMMKVEEDRVKIGNDRVEVEKMRVNASLLMAEADRKLSEANSAMSQANIRIEQSKNLDNKNNIRNQELSVREDRLKFDLKNIEMERNHLIELKEFVEPKIKEIKEIEDNILASRKEIEVKHQEIINKSEENVISVKSLEDKKSKLDSRELEIKKKEEELRKKIVLSEK